MWLSVDKWEVSSKVSQMQGVTCSQGQNKVASDLTLSAQGESFLGLL